MTFTELKVKEEIVRSLNEEGIKSPTKIQKLAIPLIKSGRDVVGISNTGSGKTAAFGIPVLEKVQRGKGLQVLITCPTRELAVQISRELGKFSKHSPVTIATIYGGVSLDPQVQRLKKAEIAVGTTGRLCDHLNRGTLNLSKLTCFVLDEADKMVEMGFIEDIELLLSKTPKQRQILLFGATISDEIKHIQKKYMHNFEIAKAEAHVKEDYLEQYYYDVLPNEKFSLLVHLLHQEKEKDRAIIFCSTRATVEILADNLKMQGLKVAMLHGKLSQNKRLRIIEQFNQDRPKILVASAVAARGLDIKGVSHIFNYGLSNDPQEYVHRVGRTARAGETGKAFTLLEPRDHAAFDQIMQRYRLPVKKLEKGEFKKLRFQSKNRSRTSKKPFQRRHHSAGKKPRFGIKSRRRR